MKPSLAEDDHIEHRGPSGTATITTPRRWSRQSAALNCGTSAEGRRRLRNPCCRCGKPRPPQADRSVVHARSSARTIRYRLAALRWAGAVAVEANRDRDGRRDQDDDTGKSSSDHRRDAERDADLLAAVAFTPTVSVPRRRSTVRGDVSAVREAHRVDTEVAVSSSCSGAAASRSGSGSSGGSAGARRPLRPQKFVERARAAADPRLVRLDLERARLYAALLPQCSEERGRDR